MKVRSVQLPDGRIWLRVADPAWEDPLDPSFAGIHGGRWNPPGSHPTLYLNGDIGTALLQIGRMLEGSPVRPDDLDDGAFVLVAATLPRAQICAEAVTNPGLRALGLSPTYPLDPAGKPVGSDVCRPIGVALRRERLRGVWCRSAASEDGAGTELAWIPATTRSVARPAWRAPLPLGAWRHAVGWADLGFADQPEPRPVPTQRRRP